MASTVSPSCSDCGTQTSAWCSTYVSAGLAPIAAALPVGGAAALFCVERDPEACHRSLIAQRLADHHDLSIEHLRPASAPHRH